MPSHLTESDMTDARTLAEPGHQAAAPRRSLIAKVHGRFLPNAMLFLHYTIPNTYNLHTYNYTCILILIL